MGDSSTSQPDWHAPRSIGVGWWLQQLVGLVLTLGLMGVLALALMMLTRMPLEGTSEPDAHWPTFTVWFVLCTGLVVGGLLRSSWRQLKDERVYTDLAGNELRVDRWSPPHERDRIAQRWAADERLRERHRQEQAAHEQTHPRAPRSEPTSEELRAAALRRREVGPGVPTSVRSGRWARPLELLRLVARVCMIVSIPLALALVVVLDLLDPAFPREWALVSFLLFPIGWVLMWAHQLLRHRWLGTRESRSDLAGFQGMSALLVAFVLGLAAFTGLVDREFIVVTVIGLPLVVVLGWVAKNELRHHIPSSHRDGGSSDVTDVTTFID